MKLAFCHPVLFGYQNVTRLETFLEYYRLIGFDHFFFWAEEGTGVDSFFMNQHDVTFNIYDQEFEVESSGFFYFPEVKYHNGMKMF